MNTVVAKKIIDLKNKDLKLRNELIKKEELSNGYNEEMEALHNTNAKELSQIIDEIGYPTIDKVGKEANEAAWLIIQHSIGQPEFMKKSAEMLKKAVQENKADPISLAYLADRIAVFEGKEQLYGTQFDWDINGVMSPNQIDDIEKVNLRRKTLGLNSLEEQTVIMKERVKKENQSPPDDFQERKSEYNEWRKSAGWIE
ncbi:hypothetical protein D2V08_14780 [Flagellimonas lutimaris]|uniref:Uncharacterized protein n=1 Tax=Flagellimonas lutimaris TaxID=475082 RepID=A0A3A1N533_9FLAO|nr:DUF6624 domain-containing protein [Allomuricauda lutimaris]RIV30366.1 hypothetical protein D2V08_14780 [Allomuricauda lutimaris]